MAADPGPVAGRRGSWVLISSHLISEMALTADRVVVIGQGS